MQKLGATNGSTNEYFRIFVGGLSFEVDNNRLREAFSHFNNLKKALVIRDQRSGQSRGYGFVTFSCKKSFQTALSTPVVILGRKADCHPVLTKGALKEQEQRDMANKVFVGGISQNTLAEDLKRYFARFGPLLETRILYDGKTGKSRGFGFVLYKSAASVDALFSIPEHKIKGKIVEIKKFSKDKEFPDDSKMEQTPEEEFEQNQVQDPKSASNPALSLCTTASNGASRELQGLIESKQNLGGLATRSADANQDKASSKKMRFDSISTLSDRELGLPKIEKTVEETKVATSAKNRRSNQNQKDNKHSKVEPQVYFTAGEHNTYEEPQSADQPCQATDYSAHYQSDMYYADAEWQGYNPSNVGGRYPRQDTYYPHTEYQTYSSYNHQADQGYTHPSYLQNGFGYAQEQEEWSQNQGWQSRAQPEAYPSKRQHESHFTIGGFYSKLQQPELRDVPQFCGGSIIPTAHLRTDMHQSLFRR